MFPVSSVPVYFCYQGIVLSGTSSRVLPVSRSRGPSGPRPLLLPLFTGVRGIVILRTSPFGHSPKFAARNSHMAFADRHRICRPRDRPDRQRRPSAAERGLFVQPGELVRVAHRVDAGDPPLRHHQADRRVELAGQIDPTGGGGAPPPPSHPPPPPPPPGA